MAEIKENEDALFNQYNKQYARLINSKQIMTTGKAGCKWILFGTSKGMNNGQYSFKIKCNTLPDHSVSNSIGMIGCSTFDKITNYVDSAGIEGFWNSHDALIDFDGFRGKDEDKEDDDEDEEEEEDEDAEPEMVTICYVGDGTFYKNDQPIDKTKDTWSTGDEITVQLDFDKMSLVFLKNGKAVSKTIGVSRSLMWLPVLQCCGCKGHHYTCTVVQGDE
mmetsp:Transcript_47162/g.78270  ORF Transcript_47162/g.78270 Transcript_47162/m.78270 type:complete len:219 (-) Transcript_47162:49-705(-)